MTSANDSGELIQPILVVLVWRGGARLRRVLESLKSTEHFFKRIVISLTCEDDSEDLAIVQRYRQLMETQGTPTKAELIVTGTEFPTMKHQGFWIDYLKSTGADDADWICWMAYDDEINKSGLEHVTSMSMSWPLEKGHSYLGPWKIRHETPDELWTERSGTADEIWTCLERGSNHNMPVDQWLASQLRQPTYIQMSGSVMSLSAHARLVNSFPRKRGPMRIEMATVLASDSATVSEFHSPISIIYGRSNSDRASYGKAARREDVHLALLAASGLRSNPVAGLKRLTLFIKFGACALLRQVGIRDSVSEEWRTADL